jgi:peroxiredoxin Q/BCP
MEACGFRDAFQKIKRAGALVFGISADKPSAQKKFKEKYNLPFSLLADPDKAIARKFEVLKEKSLYGKKYIGVDRTTFVISPQGKIAAVINGLRPEEHAQAVLAAMAAK